MTLDISSLRSASDPEKRVSVHRKLLGKYTAHQLTWDHYVLANQNLWEEPPQLADDPSSLGGSSRNRDI